MFNGLFDVRQEGKIGIARAEAQDAAAMAREAVLRIESLEQRIERLQLLNRALWGVLQKKIGLTEIELTKEVEILENAEPRSGPTAAVPCPSCQRPVSRRHSICLYCGGPVDARTPDELLKP